MNRTKLLLLFICLFCLIGFIEVGAQENEPQGQLWYVWKAVVKPAEHNQYLELSQKITDICREEAFPYSFFVWANPVFQYYWYYPIKDVKDTEFINRAWYGLYEKLGAESTDAFFSTLDYYEEKVLYERLDLSLLPNDSTVNWQQAGFAFKQIFHVIPGKNRQMESYIKEFNTLLAEHDISSLMRCATGILGYENPSYILFDHSSNVVNFWTEYGNTQSKIGLQMAELNQKISTCFRRSESEMLWYVAPCSYQVDSKK